MTRLSDGDPVSSPLAELRDLPAEPDWREMETRLVAAFGRMKTPAASPLPRNGEGSRVQGFKGSAWQWAAAASAAAVLLAAAITFYPAPGRHGTVVSKPAQPPAVPAKPAESATGDPPRVAPAPPPARPKAASPKISAKNGAAAPAAVSPDLAAANREPEDTAGDFMALPGAIGLPAFESGRIVRMEVPLSALPVYGIDLGPDVTPEAVQADFLIGQDGVPRAIRLAANSQRQ